MQEKLDALVRTPVSYTHLVQRQQPDPERLHEKEVLFLRQTVQLLRLFRGDGKGLFAQNVLALLPAELAVFVVQGVGAVSYTHLDVYKRQPPSLPGYRTSRGFRCSASEKVPPSDIF